MKDAVELDSQITMDPKPFNQTDNNSSQLNSSPVGSLEQLSRKQSTKSTGGFRLLKPEEEINLKVGNGVVGTPPRNDFKCILLPRQISNLSKEQVFGSMLQMEDFGLTGSILCLEQDEVGVLVNLHQQRSQSECQKDEYGLELGEQNGFEVHSTTFEEGNVQYNV